MLNRIEMLEQLRKEDSNDPFPPYALAVEYRAAGDIQKAIVLWKEVTRQFPDYLPAYYPLIAAFIECASLDQAADFAKRGIELAKQQNKLKTLSEIKSLIEQEIDWED